MNDNETPTIVIPDDLHPGFGDVESMFNMRTWLEKAVTAQGAKVTGGGIGMGVADIDIELEGFGYWINIKPITR